MATGSGVAFQDGASAQEEASGRFVGTGVLTSKQRRFVGAIVTNGGNQSAAAIDAGYQNPSKDACRLMTLPHVKSAIREGVEAMICSAGAKSVGWMIKALDDMALPGATRYAAAKWLAEAAGFGLAVQRAQIDAQNAESVDPSNMTLAQLDDLARRLERSITTLKAEDQAIPGEVVRSQDRTLALTQDKVPEDQ
jgi:hypothetical protein